MVEDSSTVKEKQKVCDRTYAANYCTHMHCDRHIFVQKYGGGANRRPLCTVATPGGKHDTSREPDSLAARWQHPPDFTVVKEGASHGRQEQLSTASRRYSRGLELLVSMPRSKRVIDSLQR